MIHFHARDDKVVGPGSATLGDGPSALDEAATAAAHAEAEAAAPPPVDVKFLKFVFTAVHGDL